MSKDSRPNRPGKRSIIHMVPLQPYAVQFADSDGHIRSYYAFRNPAGVFFLLDVAREGMMLAEPINVPDFARVEKLQTPPPLGKAKIVTPPPWLESEMNAYLSSSVEDKKADEAAVPAPGAPPGMETALMDEEDEP